MPLFVVIYQGEDDTEEKGTEFAQGSHQEQRCRFKSGVKSVSYTSPSGVKKTQQVEYDLQCDHYLDDECKSLLKPSVRADKLFSGIDFGVNGVEY